MSEEFDQVNGSMFQLTERVFLVTGAGGAGIGAGVCTAIREAGGQLVVNDEDEESAATAAERFSALLSVPGDVSDSVAVEYMFDTIERAGLRLDGVVNNAGIGLRKDLQEVAVDEFDRITAVDLRSVWLTSRAFARHAQSNQTDGSILNLASVHALATARRFAVYASMKAAVGGLTRGIALELGEFGIRCNALAPGFVYVEEYLSRLESWSEDPQGWAEAHARNYQALDRRVVPKDCGHAAVFLLSDASRAITGQMLAVDGGLTAMLYGKDFL